MSFLCCLFSPPEQAGCLLKRSHSRGAWQERYFVLKGSYLFYFPSRKHVSQAGPARSWAKKLHGVIPLESAKIETELPPTMAGPDCKGKENFVVTITLNSNHAFTSMHPFFVLRAPSAEVQTAWINALWQAAIPRADLVQHLQGAGKLADVLASYATNVQQNFPCADATVLSSGGRARTAALANVGSLAGMIRRHKTAPAVKDLEQLPVVTSDRPATSNVLARTASGNLVTAPSNTVQPAETVRPSPLAASGSASSATAASGGTSPAPGKPAEKAAAAIALASSTAASGSKAETPAVVAVSAVTGSAAASSAATMPKVAAR